jgi:predicted metalloenzyme YecM
MLMEQVPIFVATIETNLVTIHGTDTHGYIIDHVYWRAETLEEYSSLVDALTASAIDKCMLLSELEIGGCTVATFSLMEGIQVSNDDNCIIDVIEVPFPKDGSLYQTSLEHLEYILVPKINNKSISETMQCPLNDDIHQSTLKAFME